MKLNSIQIAGLRVFAAVPTDRAPLAVVEDPSLLPMAQSAYALGKIDGKAELARELLQAEEDRTLHERECLLTGVAHR